MKNKLAFDLFQASVDQHMQLHAPEVTTATRAYIENAGKLFDVFMSSDPLGSEDDARLAELKVALGWFSSWKEDLQENFQDKFERARRLVAWQTYDICFSVNGLCDMIRYLSENEFISNHGPHYYILPKRLSQDILESHFSQQRGACGGSSNITAHTYSYNNQRLILTRNNKCLEQDTPLPKRKHFEKIESWKIFL